ncbi:sulfurtransferase TusA family protein [Desulforamulus aquiferis]|uniref:Sulfurtransferase TusA family protein n=1 Tax=Desulforamulus aquiferis TaxID=1397668 RepID=A0AAW7ZHC9_9FIRM|nr:sulfurtransferase TusA family protein [Desulforamulus aquiferis]MDO7788683.1 sulfurtransferase TusA family protein [Desulforamulus aquiferis]RYD05327.1 hypothetical protein N752_09790 [Desulforamulus aquiferis]
MKKVVDARGLSCPEPVILTRRVLQEQGIDQVEVIVDNKTAVENITRTAENLGWLVKVQEQNEEYILIITR